MNATTRPLIILGAGASHDFVNPELLNCPEPPTTDQLVLRDRQNQNLIQNYPGIADLFSYVAPFILRKENPLSFEEAVSKITDHIERTSLLFYLSDYFTAISSGDLRKQHVNNYKTLKRYIKNSPAKGADVFTFNYDTLFEQQLDGWPFLEMSKYVSDQEPIRVFKLHGSSDWFYIYRKSAISGFNKPDSAYEFIKTYASHKGEHLFTRAMLQEMSDTNDFFRIPALAIPIEATKLFVMPEDHVQRARDILSQVSRILIIGWRGGDKHLLDLMNENFKYKVPTFLVTGPQGGSDMRKNLEHVNNLDIKAEIRGFSNFVSSEMAQDFFES